MEKLIPQPKKQELLGGEYTFSESYAFDGEKFPYAAEYLAGFLRLGGGEEITVTTDGKMEKEEYCLEIGEKITVTASGEEGVFRALSTLKQLAAEGTVPQMKIYDAPDIKNRGIMLDISRGKIPTMRMLSEIIDFMADLKYNHLQLYMDGFVFEFKHFEQYCRDTMPITVSELCQIKEHCKKRFIELVPNQNGFGHMEKWVAKPELAHLAIKRSDGGVQDTINPLDPRSFELVDTIYSDLLPEFDSDFVNIGGDEPFSLGMGQTEEECRARGKSVVYIEFLNKIIRLVNDKYKKTPMCWDDIIFSHPEILERLDKDCIVMDWGYEGEMPFSERCRKLKELGLKFYVCPGTSTWGSFTGRFVNMVYNIEAAVAACREYSGEGFLLTDWGDGGNPQFFSASILPYMFGACCAWNSTKEWDNATYDKQYSIMRACERYADRFIFKADGMAKIAHKMANYYIMENGERANGTKLWSEETEYSKGVDCSKEYAGMCLERDDAETVIEYMTGLKKQLTGYGDDVRFVKEMRCSCDIVILFAEFVKQSIGKGGAKIKADALKSGLEELKDNFDRLWKIDARPVGNDIFKARIDKLLECIE